MSFEPHTLVQLLSDHEVPTGSYGHIVEACGDSYEVEFAGEDKIIRILIHESDLALAEPDVDRCS